LNSIDHRRESNRERSFILTRGKRVAKPRQDGQLKRRRRPETQANAAWQARHPWL